MDPFTTLGIPRAFDVDVRALERVHRDLSRVLHPDRYLSGTTTEKRQALERAVEVNEAWRIVRDPIRRAEALLALLGMALGETREPSPDPEFLVDMLERREALSDARRSRDGRAVRALAETVRFGMVEAERELSDGLRVGDRDSPVRALGKLRFYRRFLDEVSAMEDELG
jgi:molecular chaperone HscB